MNSNQLKVAQVMGGGALGGAENFFFRLFKSLHQSGVTRQKAFVRPYPERVADLSASGAEYATFRFGSALHWWDRQQFRRRLKAYEPEVVLTWMNRATQYTPKGPYTLISRLGHFYDLKYHRQADYWIGNTQGICDYLVQGGMPAQRVAHIGNFVDEAPVATPVTRASLHTPEEVPVLLANGRLHVNKGFDTLLKAFAKVPEAHLWLAGLGPEEQALKRLCADLELTHRVHFLGWRQDIPALLEAADCFVCPSRHEGLGSVVLEAWYRGCPVVSTRSQGPGELIEHGSSGLLTEIDDVPALTAAIQEMLAQPQLQQAVRNAGQAEYQARFSRQSITAQFEAFFQSAAGR